MSINTVIKRNGQIATFDPDKLNKWAIWADKSGVKWSDVSLKTIRKLYDGIPTSDLQMALIDTCLEYKTEEHASMAARLMLGHIYSIVYSSFTPKVFSSRYKTLVANGYWKDFNLTDHELSVLNKTINYKFDEDYEYSSLRHWYDKFALRNLSTGDIVETPQETLLGVAICNCEFDDSSERIKNIVSKYNAFARRLINISTPIMSSSRTGENAQASCCVITAGDTLDSISAANHVAYHMTASRAGIGFEYNVRSLGDIVGNHKCIHSGKIPQYKSLLSSIKSVSQGTRGGAATVSFNVLDPEIHNLLELKIPTSPSERRILDLDFSLVWNNEFMRRVARNRDWLIISLKDAPDLYDAFYNKRDEFTILLDRYITSGKIGTRIPARTIMNAWISGRQDTGRYYHFNVDNVNDHTPFNKTVRLSNLCQEVCLPTESYNNIQELYRTYQDGDGMTALCFLLGIDVAKLYVLDNASIEETYYQACVTLDNIIENMHYPFENIKSTAQGYRSIGIGITNLAYWMAMNGHRYDDDAGRTAMHELAEKHLFNLIKASVRLAKERGAFKFIDKTKWSKGILPIDTYNRGLDKEFSWDLKCDWGSLRSDVIKYGVRFSTHVAHMPCESSSIWGYSTNGLYPIRDKIIFKKRPEGSLLFIPPGYSSIGHNYQYAWDINNRDLTLCYAIFQKFCEQSISADDYVDYNKLMGGKVNSIDVMRQMLFATSVGIKTSYYLNQKTGSTTNDEIDSDPCGGACKL